MMEERIKLDEALRYLSSYARSSGSYMSSALQTVVAEIKRTRDLDFQNTNFGKPKNENLIGAASLLSKAGNSLKSHSLESWLFWLQEEVQSGE